MAGSAMAGADEMPEPRLILARDIAEVLRLGWCDFCRAPLFGLFFSALYVAGGIALDLVLAAAGRGWWLMPFAVGFPILAPFAAVGLYEVSRRLECGQALSWRGVMRAVLRQRERQLTVMVVVIMGLVVAGIALLHALFLICLGAPLFLVLERAPDLLLTGPGIVFLIAGSAIAGLLGLVSFALTAVSLPLLMAREISAGTAMTASVAVVLHNPGPMLLWALVILAALGVAMIPAFLGLVVALPVLGHASWHMYRRTLRPET